MSAVINRSKAVKLKKKLERGTSLLSPESRDFFYPTLPRTRVSIVSEKIEVGVLLPSLQKVRQAKL